jgi:hypothetical protein
MDGPSSSNSFNKSSANLGVGTTFGVTDDKPWGLGDIGRIGHRANASTGHLPIITLTRCSTEIETVPENADIFFLKPAVRKADD